MYKIGDKIKYYYADLADFYFHTGIISTITDRGVITTRNKEVLFSEIMQVIQ